MNPYRCLSDEELLTLEEEFKSFLIVNSIYSEDWLKLNNENPHKAKDLVELFSKMVFDKIVSSCQFLMLKNTHLIQLLKKEKDQIHAIWIKVKPTFLGGFSSLKSDEWNSTYLECFTGIKNPTNINKEWFDFMELGYQKTDEETWNFYMNFIEKTRNRH